MAFPTDKRMKFESTSTTWRRVSASLFGKREEKIILNFFKNFFDNIVTEAFGGEVSCDFLKLFLSR